MSENDGRDGFTRPPASTSDWGEELELDEDVMGELLGAGSAASPRGELWHGARAGEDDTPIGPLGTPIARERVDTSWDPNEAARARGSYFSDVVDAPAFVLRGDGKWILFFAAVWMLVTYGFVQCVPYPPIKLLIIMAGNGFVAGYMMRVVNESSSGADELADFPEIDSWWDAGIVPMFQTCALILGYVVLPIVVIAKGHVAPGVALLILMLGLYPMGYLNLSLRGALFEIAPGWQLRAMTKAPGHYAVMVAMTYVIAGVSWGSWAAVNMLRVTSSSFVVVAGTLFASFLVTVYFSAITSHVIGRFFYWNEDAIGFE